MTSILRNPTSARAAGGMTYAMNQVAASAEVGGLVRIVSVTPWNRVPDLVRCDGR